MTAGIDISGDATAGERTAARPRDSDGPETVVPPDENPPRCSRCDRPFTTERARNLHLGTRHEDLTEREQEAYRAARDDEGDELFLYHLKVIAALGGFYAIFVLVYMVVLSG